MDQVAENVLERRIAGKYMGKVLWEAVVWGLCNCLIFITLFPLVLSGLVPIWAGFCVATLNVILSYLPSHEAQDNIIASRGKPPRLLNDLSNTFPLFPWPSHIACCERHILNIISTRTIRKRTVKKIRTLSRR